MVVVGKVHHPQRTAGETSQVLYAPTETLVGESWLWLEMEKIMKSDFHL